ncbi:glycoside hydrolase family 2 protein [Niabella hibiscisoli]|uniref:glycoside hydrolase family 2 protein n=1 Tax=Niabella hibiscisoli TaxID=1825928 RepID=UPI001F1010AC|nr:sugar-binding domain-containing protein [Niabella hibiscisoli]MCH5720584.1 hypothetical protein [Niabella hibiscisoli]
MRILFSCLAAVVVSMVANAQGTWKIVPGKPQTPWVADVNPAKTLPEYPRPQLKRTNWQNWNGLWKYAITPASEENIPASFQGDILVPYPVESALSGVGKTVGKNQVLWYSTNITLSKPSGMNQVMLNFGAVDWRCDVFVNGKKVGRHEGGFDPFSFNITSYLGKGKQQAIALRVWDPTDDGPQPRGKQVKKPEGIWYTPVTGVWQTVWTEVLPATHITSTKHTPDVDAGQLRVSALVEAAQAGDIVKFVALDGAQQIGEVTVPSGVDADIKIENAKLWSPASPYLYNLKVYLYRAGKQIDYAESYFAMRKSSLVKDAAGVNRMALNNKILFQYGPLDQGWWPDGLFTAPTDKALLFDIVKTKEMGFNMIRKHIAGAGPLVLLLR